MECIAYKSGYKYQLSVEYSVTISILPDEDIVTDYIDLAKDGKLVVKKGYAWDGPSGPTFDTHDFMRGSLVHDALYQLMRNELLDKDKHRVAADKLLRSMCREDGMNPVLALWVYNAVRMFADPAADPANRRPVTRAPKPCRRL